MTFRILTWNVQALFPVAPAPNKWSFLEDLDPSVAILTEAKPPTDPTERQLLYRPGGLGPHRRWGTIVAVAPHLEALPVTSVRWKGRTHDVNGHWPGTVVACDIVENGRRLVTVIGAYALNIDMEDNSVGHGRITLEETARSLRPVLESRDWSRVIVGGDFNAWPSDVRPIFERHLPLIDLVEATAKSRPGTHDCLCTDPKPCPHLWTHRNKSKQDGFQQLDYLLATPDLAGTVTSLRGGPDDFPGIWDLSDHAPLEAALDIGDVATRSPGFLGRIGARFEPLAERLDPDQDRT